MNKISKFVGKNRFLSNDYMADVIYNGILYCCNTSAFESQRSTDSIIRMEFADLSPYSAKVRGRCIETREDWNTVKEQIMMEICVQKFLQNPKLMKQLFDTGDAELINSNNYKDTYWGTYNGKGSNTLGKILMQIREDLKV